MGSKTRIIIVSVVVMILLFLFYRNERLAKASLNWPSVEGVVVVSKISKDRKKNDDPNTKKIKKYVTKYHLNLRYKYEVEGKVYSSSNISYHRKSIPNDRYNRKYSEQTSAKYPVGKKVKVYYDPSDHERSVLERR